MLRKTLQTVRCSLVRETATMDYELTRGQVRHGGDVASMIRAAISSDPRECFVAVLLNAKNRVIGLHEVSVGIADSAPVHPREVFTAAVVLSATAIVIAHNHPSGDVQPSDADRQVTLRLKQAGELLGIQVLDHVIVGTDRYYSFADGIVHAFPVER